MRIVLLGARGFIGRHVLKGLLDHGHAVTTVGRRPFPGTHVFLDPAQEAPDRLAELLAGGAGRVVVNCAGATGSDTAQLAAANVDLPAWLVEAMVTGAPSGRLVHLGSGGEYGWVEPGTATTEGDPTRPVGIYGLSKLAGTRVVRMGRSLGLETTVLRVSNPVGPRAPVAGVAGRLAAEIRRAQAEGGPVRLGPVDAVRDFVDVRDVAGAVRAAVTAPVLDAPVLNIGSGRGVMVKELVDLLVSASGFSGEIRHDADGSARSEAVPWQMYDVRAAREHLGWEPTTRLRTTMEDLWTAATS